MTAQPLRVGVVGVGHLGRHHARILADLPGAALTAVVDIDAERVGRVASDLGTRSETDAAALLGAVDAVTVAVPTESHARVATPFLEAGIPVLVEKPIAASLSQADTMVRAADASGATLAVGHSERYNPAITTALPLVSHPRFVEVHRLASFQARGLDVDVVFDMMIHDLDVLLALVHSEPAGVEAVGVPVLSDRVDIANARVRFENGCLANLTASRISRDRVRRLRFFQPDSLIMVDCAARQVEAWQITRASGQEPGIDGGPVPVPAGEPLEVELADFVLSVASGKAPVVDGRAGRRALALAERIAAAMDEEQRRWPR